MAKTKKVKAQKKLPFDVDVVITAPPNDLINGVSFAETGSTDFSGTCSFVPVTLSYSIDGNNPIDFDATSDDGQSWNLPGFISADECPDDEGFYGLVVYGWDENGDMHTGVTIFLRDDTDS